MIKEFRPELLPQIRQLAIRANRNFLSRTLTGNWLSSFKGRGIEFSDYRVYTAGDDASLIDWRASLRARKILVKELTEEKNLNVFVCVDVSNSMLYGSGGTLKAEYAAQVASSVVYAALRAGDSAGLILYTDQIETFIKPAIGMKQHSLVLDILAKPDNYGGGQDFGKVMTQIMGATKQRGIIIVVSDFIGMDDRWNRYLEIASGRFELVGLMIRDPRDRRLPRHAAEYVLEDPYSDKKLIIDTDTYADAYAEYVVKEEARVREYFRMVRGDTLLLETSEDFVRPLRRFFQKRSAMVDH